MIIWKKINSDYLISSSGKIYSIKSKKCLKPNKVGNGYLKTDLYHQGKRSVALIHRLVAEAFIPNPNGLLEVNHKDECKSNNSVENLEWCNRKYNNSYSKIQEKLTDKKEKQIYQYTLNGDLVAIWKSARDCERNSQFFQSAICRCCLGLQKQHKGYKWSFNPL